MPFDKCIYICGQKLCKWHTRSLTGGQWLAWHIKNRATPGLGDWWILEFKHSTQPLDSHCFMFRSPVVHTSLLKLISRTCPMVDKCALFVFLFTTGLTLTGASPPPQRSGRNPGSFVPTWLAPRIVTPLEGGFGDCSVSLCTRKWNGLILLYLDLNLLRVAVPPLVDMKHWD